MQLPKNSHEMIQLKDAQRILNINRNMIHDLIKSGSLPAQKIGNEWQILRKNLVLWMEKNNEETESSHYSSPIAANSGMPAYYDDWT